MTYSLNILRWKRAGSMKPSRVQQVAPTNAMSIEKLGTIAITT